jgi:hypothetical protein
MTNSSLPSFINIAERDNLEELNENGTLLLKHIFEKWDVSWFKMSLVCKRNPVATDLIATEKSGLKLAIFLYPLIHAVVGHNKGCEPTEDYPFTYAYIPQIIY